MSDLLVGKVEVVVRGLSRILRFPATGPVEAAKHESRHGHYVGLRG